MPEKKKVKQAVEVRRYDHYVFSQSMAKHSFRMKTSAKVRLPEISGMFKLLENVIFT